MPVGVDVAARTPAEIGVAMAAELIAWRAKLRPGRSTSPGKEPPSARSSAAVAPDATQNEVDA
jgi:xanthine dehydrogenase accessory factor